MAEKFEQIQQLKSLLDSGVLTQEEFDSQKQSILEKPENEKVTTRRKKLSNRGLIKAALAVLIITVCCIVGISKFRDYQKHQYDITPKTSEQVKEEAIKEVQTFIKDLYEGENYYSDVIILTDVKPANVFEAAQMYNIKINPDKISYSSNIKEVRTGEKLDYVYVETKYNGKKIIFKVSFRGEGKTGTEGRALVWSTIGLCSYDAKDFKQKNGFDLIYNTGFDDYYPFEAGYYAIEASKVVKDYLQKHKINATILSAETPHLSEYKEAFKLFPDDIRIEIHCSNNQLFIVTRAEDENFNDCFKIIKIQQSDGITSEKVAGLALGAKYDETLKDLKKYKDNMSRGIGTDDNHSFIGLFQKNYRGVCFDFVDCNFKSGTLSSIELRKTANSYDNNPEKIIQNSYNTIVQNLKKEYSAPTNKNGELTFKGNNEIIKVSQTNDDMTQERELRVNITRP